MYNNLNIDIKYASSETNIVDEFYIPVLKISKQYDRAVGYFSSSILKEYVSSLRNFYFNGGHIRLIISPKLSSEDIQTLEKTQDKENQLKAFVEKDLFQLFDDENALPTDIFFNLIMANILEVKIAISINPLGMFHEKIGLFYSTGDEVIAIMGSNNETLNSVSANQESFDVYKSWIPGQNEYVVRHQQDFEKYWRGESKSLYIYDLDEATHKKIFERVEQKELPVLFKELDKHSTKQAKAELLGLNFVPYSYQEEAVEVLLNAKRGILKFATGSGKTKTAIYFMKRMEKISSKNLFIIVVPDKTLVSQWYSEVIEYFDSTITAYSENPKWRTQFRTFKDIYTNSKIAISQQVIITTTSTMFKDGKDGDFMSIVDKLGDFILIADECHNMATDRIVNSLPSPSWRLGLSATPESVSKKELSDKIISYFGGIIAEYSLGDAIRDKKLVEYNYYPVFVEFTEEEKNQYDILSKNIAKLQSMLKETKDFEMRQSLEMTLFKRARIVYGAANKIPKLKEMLQDDAIERDHLLIYCGATSYQIPPIDDETEDVIENEENTQITLSQLNLVNELLRDLDIKAVQYTQSESEADRRLAFELFRTNTFSTLVAIKCLDEGVNIPEIENAIILASSGNIREFIQRRGRILRKSEGKDHANIYDFVVRDYEDFNSSLNIKETRRIMEYAKEARNYHQIYNENIEYIEMVKEKDDEQRDEF